MHLLNGLLASSKQSVAVHDLDNGWDGSPEGEVQHMFGSHYYEYSAYLSEADTTASENTDDNNSAYSSEEEGYDGSPLLTRAEKKALKREIPWRHIDAEDAQQFIDSVIKEWSEWIRYSSCRKMTLAESRMIAKKLIIPARTCFKWKILADGYSKKAKARIVVQGFRDPHLPLLARDAPVLARLSLMAIIQWQSTTASLCGTQTPLMPSCRALLMMRDPSTST